MTKVKRRVLDDRVGFRLSRNIHVFRKYSFTAVEVYEACRKKYEWSC